MGMKAVYVFTAFLSVVLYVAGIFTGVNIQQNLSQSLERDLASIKADIENQQQELILLSLSGESSCAVLQSLSSTIASKLESISNDIRAESTDSKFNELKELYSTLSIRAWLLKSSIKENCESPSLSILYYYSFPCTDCRTQEAVLESIKSIDREKIFTYAVDKDVKNNLVQTLVKSHQIESAPSLVIGSDVYRSLTNETKLEGIVCQNLNISCPENQTSIKSSINVTNISNDTTNKTTNSTLSGE